MSRFRRSVFARSFLLPLSLLIWLSACTSYSPIGLGEVADHGRVRVTTTDGNRTTVVDPRVEADSIKGQEMQPIAVGSVTKLEAVGTDEVGTVFTVLGVAALVGVIVLLVVCDEEVCFNVMQP